MKNIIYICFALLLVSCYDINKPKKPENLIAKDKMVNIIIDMSLLNSAKGINKRSIEKKNINIEQFIYEKHNIDSLQFTTSNNYYAYNINEYEAIYSRVKDSLTQLKEEYTAKESKRKNAKRKRDSIRKEKNRDSIFRNKKGLKNNKGEDNLTANKKKKKKNNKKRTKKSVPKKND